MRHLPYKASWSCPNLPVQRSMVGDGCLTPSISVVSSISGLQQISSIGEGAAPALTVHRGPLKSPSDRTASAQLPCTVLVLLMPDLALRQSMPTPLPFWPLSV